MKFEREPIYKLILEDMQWERMYDEAAARTLSKLLEQSQEKNP